MLEKVLESENINYVKVSQELIDDYLKMVNDVEIQKLINDNPYTFSYEEELTWIKLKKEDNDIFFSMIEKSTNEYIGNIEIMKIENNIGELGICITREKQNKHYGRESIKRILKYCYEELKLDGVDLKVHKDNLRAITCYKRVGFIIDKELEKNNLHMIHQKERND